MDATHPTLKLYYYGIVGRAESTRKMLRLAGVPFQDERLTRAEFAKIKATLPDGQVPVLEIDDEMISKPQAIMRYAARVAGFYPQGDPLAALMVEEILTTLDEMSESKLIPTFLAPNEEVKRAMREAWLAGPLPTVLSKVEERLVRMAEYPVFKDSAKLSVHELEVSDLVALFQSGKIDYIPTTIVDECKTMLAIHAKVKTFEPVASTQPALDVKPPAVPRSLKLEYFGFAGRGDMIRLAFHIGGIAFEDERISFADWGRRKSSTPLGQLPVLTIDGVDLVQSYAILRYAGTLSGLYPLCDPLKAAKVDEIIARAEVIYASFRATYEEQDEEKVRAMREALAVETIPRLLGLLDKRVALWKQTGAYVVGDEMTIADLVVNQIVQFLQSGMVTHFPTTIAGAFATLQTVDAAVMQHPRVQDWYAMPGKK